MKQVFQSMMGGATSVDEVPAPQPARGSLLIRSDCTLISAGTERMLVKFGRSNLIDKARQQPEKVRQVLNKMASDGVLDTIRAVRNRLDAPFPLGYSNAGTVLAVGEGVEGWSVGDRVLSNGPHAEVVTVPRNLCAHIPDAVPSEDAAFTVLAAIGLQGVRLAQPTLGEVFAVFGLGLVGLLTVQLLTANGCRVIGLDFSQERLQQARRYGASTIDLANVADPVGAAIALAAGRGVDGALICASTDSNDPVSQAARMCRKRGRIVLVGVTGLELSRADFYEKELTFQVSCSYGPGRYDAEYEQQGRDYPVGFVRWTEQRNFEAVLELMERRQLNPQALITHRFAVERAAEAYDAVVGDVTALGVMLEYASGPDSARTTISYPAALTASTPAAAPARPVVAVIGAGNYASQVLVPFIAKTGARMGVISANTGANAAYLARRFGFGSATTSVDTALGDASVNTVFIATRHDSHARLAIRALQAGKHVFVEKPLALVPSELDEIQSVLAERARAGAPAILTVGFNRRFAAHSQKLRAALAHRHEPITAIYTVNAGEIPASHWTQNREVGGGRIVGEVCHFIDLLRFLVGHPIVECVVTAIGGLSPAAVTDDKCTLTLRFADGSHATVHYFANGHRSFPKERLEVFSSGRIFVIDDFRRMTTVTNRRRVERLWRQDKGHRALIEAFLTAISQGSAAPIATDELIEVSRVAIDAAARAFAGRSHAAG